MPREKKYEDEAAKQAAYRARRKAGEWNGQNAKWAVDDLHRAVIAAKVEGDPLAAKVFRATGHATLRALIDHFQDIGPKARLTDL